MKRFLTACLALASALFLRSGTAGAAPGRVAAIRSWVCFYGSALPIHAPAAYDLYILDRTSPPDLAPLKAQGSIVVGYVSTGEINKADPFFPRVPKELLLEENKDWPGAYRIDLRRRAWQSLLLDAIIPEALARGFDGVFLDTIDVAQYLEGQKGMRGSVDSAAALIAAIRKRFPGIIIVLNNGLFLLDRAGTSIDAVVVEDVYTSYDFERRTYLMADEAWIAARRAPLQAFQAKYHKPVLSLDYASPADHAGITRIAKRAAADGFIPYIADIDLSTIFFHP